MKFISYYFKTYFPTVSKFLVASGLVFSIASCQWGDQVDALVQPNPDDFAALFSDTSSVVLSTLATDSMMTGSASRQLVGRFTDPYFGKMHATSFIQVGISDGRAITVPDAAVYDSLALTLRYDGYYYGDTTKVMNVTVHRHLSDMMEKSVYYNGDETPYEAAPIGRKRFYPNPRPGVSAVGTATGRADLHIKLSDALGKQIFDLAKAGKLTNNTDFVNLLKGLTILPATSDNSAVVGFHTSSTSLKLYHHTPDAVEGVDKDSVSVALVGVYNNTGGNRKGTILEKLPNTYRSVLPSAQAGNMAFVQAGTGIMTRVDLPSIRQFAYQQNYTFVNSARLVMEPVRNSFNSAYYLPQLYVYLCDRNNDYLVSGGQPLPLTDLAGTPVVARLENDFINDRSYYLIDVTQFARNIVQSESEQTYGLLLRTSAASISNNIYDVNTEFSKSFNRVVFGDQANANARLKLEVKYTNIKTQ
jgi:hypothetical protein